MKLTTVLLVLFINIIAFSQNLQLHYDFGQNRKYITTTLEMFKTDEYGATYTFVDFDFNNDGNKSLSLAYWEIARYITLPFINKDFSFTVQYNDGVARIKNIGIAVPLGHVWLTGISYPIDLGFITLNTDLLYRSSYGSSAPDAQVTFVWLKNFLSDNITFTGFMDIWSADKNSGSGKKTVVILTEPQIWYNIYHHLSVGSEIEISNNFIPNSNKIEVNPTLAVKWIF